MKLVRHRQKTYLGHDHILALLHVFAVCFHDGLQEPQVLHVAAVGLYAVHKVLHDPLADLVAQVVVVHEDVPHGFRLEELGRGVCSRDSCEATVDYQGLSSFTDH